VGRVVIVLAGGDPVEPQLRERLPAADVVVAADAGLHVAGVLDLRVDAVVGDMDSVDPALLDAAVARGARVERHPAAKDATDLELALDAAMQRGAEHVAVVGGGGGRLDHLLGNLTLLASPRYAAAYVEAWMGGAHVVVARGGGAAVELAGTPGELVTLLPVGGDALGVTTKGLRYPLHGEPLPAGTTRGVSNVVVDGPVSVHLAAGVLLVVRPHGGPS
jgi:thiamine pyrophosphokinase